MEDLGGLSVMKRLMTAVIGVALLWMAVPAVASDPPRAMWVWEGPSAELLSFSVERGIDRLYLNSPPGFSGNSAYDEFINDAHAAGIEVYALAGDPSWAKRSRPFLRWADEVVAHGGFDGLTPDVEPYALSDWKKKGRRSKLIKSYLSALDDVVDHADGLPVIPAVPFWWDEPTFAVKGSLLIDEVLARVDGVAVLAYRDTAEGVNGILNLAGYEVALGSSLGKSVTIGVETQQDPTYEHITFYEEGQAVMETELAEVASTWNGESGFWGIAIHHFRSYQDLAP